MGMTITAAGRKGGRRRRGVPRYGAMCEINMTPFIDVMLVLLIIFMVAAPLLATGVPIEVPQTQAAALNIEQKPLVLSIDDKCTIYLNDQPVAIDGLVDRLAAVTQSNFDETIYVRGDTNANFGCIAQALAIVTVAGYHKVSLMTQEQKVIPVTEPDKR